MHRLLLIDDTDQEHRVWSDSIETKESVIETKQLSVVLDVQLAAGTPGALRRHQDAPPQRRSEGDRRGGGGGGEHGSQQVEHLEVRRSQPANLERQLAILWRTPTKELDVLPLHSITPTHFHTHFSSSVPLNILFCVLPDLLQSQWAGALWLVVG